MAVTTTVTVGALVGNAYDRWVSKSKNPEPARRLGILMASGLIVGESLFNVLLAGIIVATNNASPFGLVPADSFWTGAYPMIAGILKKVRNSGDLYSIVSRVVYAGDKFRNWIEKDIASPAQLTALVDSLQSFARVPLLVAIAPSRLGSKTTVPALSAP
mgnify:CR=1 FL=1